MSNLNRNSIPESLNQIEWISDSTMAGFEFGHDIESRSNDVVVTIPLNNKWYLNHVQSEVKFDCKWKRKLFKSTYTTLSEMAITDMDSVNINKFKLNESVKFSDFLSEQVSDLTDEDFWGEYNIIKPEESIEAAIKKINKKLIRREDKE